MSNTAELQRQREKKKETQNPVRCSPVIIISPLALLAAASHLPFVFGLSCRTDFNRSVLERYGLKGHLVAALHVS